MEAFVHGIPKAELHVHIEGTLEPELMMALAAKNDTPLPYATVADIRRAYDFKNLQSFLDIYYRATAVLQTADDFYRLTRAYLTKASAQNVRHTEFFFDPQSHTDRGIAFETIVAGIHRAILDAERRSGISSKLIMCFLRHLSAAAAMQTLEKALDFKDVIAAVGLDSTEVGFPPGIFANVFDRARRWGFRTVAHAGEEGPPDYIRQALTLLRAERIDHGVRCIEDAGLVNELAAKQIPLTVCPLSNVKLKIFDRIQDHNAKKLMGLGLCVTVNSDDPAYFGGYIEENFLALQRAHGLTRDDIQKLARNGFKASFLNRAQKEKHLRDIDRFVNAYRREDRFTGQ